MKESKLQDKCIKYLKTNKIYYLNIYGSGRSGKGAPDLITCIKGKFVSFELKVGKNKMQDDQIIQKRRIEASGGLHYTPYTFDEFKQIIDRLIGGSYESQ